MRTGRNGIFEIKQKVDLGFSLFRNYHTGRRFFYVLAIRSDHKVLSQ